MDHSNAKAGPSTSPNGTGLPGPSPYHESSQFRDWRYSASQLASLRKALNERSKEVVARNTELEKEAQKSLGHEFTDPPPATTYLTVEDELLLLRFYLTQASTIMRSGFGLPEVVESTAMSYLKRFYVKSSVMEWHPRIIMPTCIYLAAKTTNYPVLMHHFTPKFAKLDPEEIIDTEFVVSQSLSFQFWVRGPEKPLHGWALDFQSQPDVNVTEIQKALAKASEYLSASRLTDAEFIYTPSQIALASLHLADKTVVESFLEWRYSQGDPPFDIDRNVLMGILDEIEVFIKDGKREVDMKKVKNVDKRLRQCTNPAKIPGTALYIQRKAEQAEALVASKAEKTMRIKQEMSEREAVFGDVIQTSASAPPKVKKDTRTWSPRVTMGEDRELEDGHHAAGGSATGMGVKDEAMGNLTGGAGLKDVGETTEEG